MKDNLLINVHSFDTGNVIKQVKLPKIFYGVVNELVIKEVILYQLNKQRVCTASTKNVSEVSGSGKKMRPQKGTGRARMGHKRPPHHRGGAVIHGPGGKVYSYSIPRKKLRIGLYMSLRHKLLTNNLIVVDNLSVAKISTKNVIQQISNLNIANNKQLFVDSVLDNNFVLSTRNIFKYNILPAHAINTLNIWQNEKLILTEAALNDIGEKHDKVL